MTLINNGKPLSLAGMATKEETNPRAFVKTKRTATGSFFVGKSVSHCGEETNFQKPLCERDPRSRAIAGFSTCYQWVGGSIAGTST